VKAPVAGHPLPKGEGLWFLHFRAAAGASPRRKKNRVSTFPARRRTLSWQTDKAISNGKSQMAKFKLFYICHLLFAICRLKFP
jgi:hypothetical protein